MAYAIAWIFERLLRLLFAPSGRHRAAHAADGRPAVRHQGAPPHARGAVVVRPYVVAYEQPWEQRQREQRAERRLRRQRRRTLRLAAHGIDIGPRVIHGVRVAA
ncbi:hypothetical protein ACWY4P_25690 [Streptomyces sp. LZ34]